MAADQVDGTQGNLRPRILFGGTFDPVHIGHLRSAIDIMEYLDVPSLTLIPSRIPPHRGTTFFSAEQRLQMLRLATASLRGVGVDDRECRRDGPSYTVDTLSSIRQEAGPWVPLILVLGFDAFLEFHRWHRWQEIPTLSSLLILDRPGFQGLELPAPLVDLLDARSTVDPRTLRSTSAGWVHRVSLTQLPISASGIRELLNQGRSLRYLVPDEVAGYLAALRTGSLPDGRGTQQDRLAPME